MAASISSRVMPFVDVRVLGDRLQGDVRHALVDEALADVAIAARAGTSGGTLAGQSPLSLLTPSGESASR